MRKLDFKTNVQNVFDKMTFKDEYEIDAFSNYIGLKGIYLHKQIYDLLIEELGECSYSLLSKILIYDKGLRNVLFKYLSALEEYLRSKLFDNFDYDFIIEDPFNHKISIKNLVSRKNSTSSNLYYITFSRFFTFHTLIDVCYKVNLISENEKTKYEVVKKLRNRTMHHNILVTSFHTRLDDVEKNITNLEMELEVLYRTLPEEFRYEYNKAINRCNNIGTKINTANIDILCLGVMNNGIFEKN